jgi:transcription antitermination factor NusG
VRIKDDKLIDIVKDYIFTWAKEKKIEDIYEIFCSYEEKVKKLANGKTSIKKENVYPEIIFVNMKFSSQVFDLIKMCPYVYGFVGVNKNNPSPLSKAEVVKLKRVGTDGCPKVNVVFEKGDRVEIKQDHPFTGFQGVVIEQINENVNIDIDIFGRVVKTSVLVSKVRKV